MHEMLLSFSIACTFFLVLLVTSSCLMIIIIFKEKRRPVKRKNEYSRRVVNIYDGLELINESESFQVDDESPVGSTHK